MRQNDEKKIEIPIEKTLGLVRVKDIIKNFGISQQGVYYHIRRGALTVYKSGYHTFLDPAEFAKMKKWSRDYTKKNGAYIYDEKNLAVATIAKKLGLRTARIYYFLSKGDIKFKKIEGCIVISIDDLIECDAIRDLGHAFLVEVANDEYIDSGNQGCRSDDPKEVSAI